MDVVVKEGCLFIQGVKFGKRIWRKTWVVVFESSAAGIGRIEMYDIREGRGAPAVPAKPVDLRKAEKRVIRLADCLSVTPAPGEACPTECIAFYLNTAERTYTLAGPTCEEWVPTLCQMAFQRSEGSGETNKGQGDSDMSMSDNDLYSTWSPAHYQVLVQSSEASVRCSVSGSYLLSPEKESLCLLDMKTGQPVFSWPYRFLRRFGQIKEGVTIEAGRRCQSGEGHFIFLSKQGAQIYKAIEEAIMHQSVQDLLSKVNTLAVDGTAHEPPPRPVANNQARSAKGSPNSSPQGLQGLAPPRRNIALPPTPFTKSPAVSPRLPAVNPRHAQTVNEPKPPLLDPRPPESGPRAPVSDPRTSANEHKPPLPEPRAPVSDARPSVPPLPEPRHSLCSPRPPAYNSKPSLNTTQPLANDPRPPASDPTEVLYSIVKPKPKPRTKPGTPKLPQPPIILRHSPTPATHKRETEIERGTGDSDNDSDYCNWNEEIGMWQDCPKDEVLYSAMALPPPDRYKYGPDASQEPDKATQCCPVMSSSDATVDFKQILSNILVKDLARVTPPPPPRTFGGSPNHFANLNEYLSDEDYCEIPD